ncbi:hypothetical protein AVEN_87684-1 [Araneus ventricosus]|uniref:Uncharacterized protein n=1 Tax=Araneus ventricosus TaxID=182803 RepID=A0A4Y2CZ10_ARAVE|nr:hypothetical protein AVEN_87684-1 [Araneus ventricosus]
MQSNGKGGLKNVSSQISNKLTKLSKTHQTKSSPIDEMIIHLFGILFLSSIVRQLGSNRGLFWDGPRHFEVQLDDEDDMQSGTPLSGFHAPPAEDVSPATEHLTCIRPNLSSAGAEFFHTEAETFLTTGP